jgi:hypothetical protein
LILAYFDESGDSGYVDSATAWFSLAGLLLKDCDWKDALDKAVEFRRRIRDEFGIQVREEIKAVNLINDKGSIRKHRLPLSLRLDIFRKCLEFQRDCGLLRTFAVVIRKDQITKKSDPREYAWQYAIQRLERYSNNQNDFLHVFPDEGHGMLIQRLIRKMRRFSMVKSAFSGGGTLSVPATKIVEDPSMRQSHESYFIQFADLNSYAASRLVYPSSKMDGTTWEILAGTRVLEVNRIKGGPPGIVVWPQ